MSTDATARQLLATTAALLDQGRLVDGLSRALTAGALIGLMLWPAFAPSPAAMVVLALVALAGFVELYLAIRVSFDAALFRRLAAEVGAPGFSDLDAALQQLGLMPPARAGRPPAERAAGAKRLLDRQGIALVVQLVLILAGAALAVARAS
jgi:hypothetical protein